MAILTRNSIVTNGLVLNLDSLNPQSLPVDPTVNLLYTNSTYTPSTQNLTLYTSSSITIPNSYFRITSSTFIPPYTGGSFRLNIPLNVLTSGKPYTLSYKYQIVSGSQFQMSDWCDTPLTNVVNIDYGSYKYASATGTAATYDATFRFMDFNMSENTIVDIWDMQLVQNTYSPPFTTSSLVTWRDLAGPGNNATLTSSSLSRTIPQYNSLNERVLTFDGTGSYATGTIAPPLSGSAFTIGFWVKPTTSINNIPFSLGTLLLTDSTIHLRIYSNNVFRFGMYSDDLDAYNFDSMVGKWNYIVCTLDSSKLQSIYQNGVLKATRTALGMYVGNNIYAVGAWTSGPSEFTRGNIGPVHVYNRALSQAEILQNYNATKTRFGIS